MSEPEPRASSDPRPPKGGTTVEDLDRSQVQHARRVAESRATVPDLTVAVEIDMEAAVALLDSPEGAGAIYEDLVVKAAGLALREAPRANGAYKDGRFERYERVNVGLVTPTAGGAATPVLFDADRRSVAELAQARGELVRRARESTLTHPEQNGATVTLSSLAAFGIATFTGPLHQPQAVGLAMGSVEPRAVVRDGALVARRTLALTLACDHRILHATDAARLLRRIRELLEQPALLTR